MKIEDLKIGDVLISIVNNNNHIKVETEYIVIDKDSNFFILMILMIKNMDIIIKE